MKPNVLSGLDAGRIFTRPVAQEYKALVKEFMFVALDGSGNVILPPADGFFPVYLVLSRSMSEPAARAGAGVSLMYGDMRILTDKIEMPVEMGDMVFAATDGYLKAMDPKPGMTAIGWVEKIVDVETPLVVVRIRPMYVR